MEFFFQKAVGTLMSVSTAVCCTCTCINNSSRHTSDKHKVNLNVETTNQNNLDFMLVSFWDLCKLLSISFL